MILGSLIGLGASIASSSMALDAAMQANTAARAAQRERDAQLAHHEPRYQAEALRNAYSPPALAPKLGRTMVAQLPPAWGKGQAEPGALICSICNRPVDHIFTFNRPDLDSFILTAICHGATEAVRIPFDRRDMIDAIQWNGISGKAFTDPNINMWEPTN